MTAASTSIDHSRVSLIRPLTRNVDTTERRSRHSRVASAHAAAASGAAVPGPGGGTNIARPPHAAAIAHATATSAARDRCATEIDIVIEACADSGIYSP